MILKKGTVIMADVAEVLDCVAGIIATERYFGGVATRPSFSSAHTGLAGSVAEESLCEIAAELSAWFDADISNGRLTLCSRVEGGAVFKHEITRMAAHRVAAHLLAAIDADAVKHHYQCAEKMRHSIMCRLLRQETAIL